MQTVQSWSETQIITVSVLGAIAFAAVVASVVEILKSRKRARDFAGKLDNAVAEVGVEQSRTISLQQELSRREVFIDRNILKGPGAVSAAPYEECPKQCQEYRPEFALDGASALGSDDKNSDRDDDDHDDGVGEGGLSAETTPDVAVDAVQSCTAMLAVRDCQVSRDDLCHRASMKEARENRYVWTRPQQGEPQAQIDRSWESNTIENTQEESPRAAENKVPTEVGTAATEVDRNGAGRDDVGAMR
ncbi:hypothetical protein MYCTH_2112081 [Thermothelomyces thermophilus ATCC 42464]|uniref:Uncharacterized protein n=1 Tax=Thermothelomyces thermophilus (strain ATCC 42464 / BCRC 31852 / DSM 1799) TaxID=573729 RepID=G2QK48_THET4|nr:uncharacterized protein MYCTH_2112081 [Thermothelomyces thermophilus ATCC 42464]AEO59954.1 hypothetical protein MYCTH_2112081 [Thermothelomyces thermophilus ATCC 42464]